MKSTFQIYLGRGAPQLNQGAANLQIYQHAGRENIRTACPEGEGETEASSHDAGKSKRSLLPKQDSHNPRTTSTELPSTMVQNPEPASSFHVKSSLQGKVSNSRTRIPSCEGTMGSPLPPHSPWATHSCPPLPTHHHM